MMTKERKPFPPELLARIRETGDAAILAGCDADETISLCKQTVAEWVKDNPDALRD